MRPALAEAREMHRAVDQRLDLYLAEPKLTELEVGQKKAHIKEHRFKKSNVDLYKVRIKEVQLFGDIRRHIMFDISPPVLNLDKFLASKLTESEQFYRVAITASSFRLFQRSRHKHERDYFDLAAAREMGLPACDESFVFSLPDFS